MLSSRGVVVFVRQPLRLADDLFGAPDRLAGLDEVSAQGPVAKFANGRGVGWMRSEFPGTPRGQPRPETNPIRPPFHLLTNFATGPSKLTMEGLWTGFNQTGG
jgi:hypothetical protein